MTGLVADELVQATVSEFAVASVPRLDVPVHLVQAIP